MTGRGARTIAEGPDRVMGRKMPSYGMLPELRSWKLQSRRRARRAPALTAVMIRPPLSMRATGTGMTPSPQGAVESHLTQ